MPSNYQYLSEPQIIRFSEFLYFHCRGTAKEQIASELDEVWGRLRLMRELGYEITMYGQELFGNAMYNIIEPYGQTHFHSNRGLRSCDEGFYQLMQELKIDKRPFLTSVFCYYRPEDIAQLRSIYKSGKKKAIIERIIGEYHET